MLSVLLGAFGTHALRGRIAPELLAAYQTGTQYQFYHSLALLVVAMLLTHYPEHTPQRVGVIWAGWLMLAGIVLFSGSLYAMSLTNLRALGAITPIGGLAFIAAWAVLAGTAFRAVP